MDIQNLIEILNGQIASLPHVEISAGDCGYNNVGAIHGSVIPFVLSIFGSVATVVVLLFTNYRKKLSCRKDIAKISKKTNT